MGALARSSSVHDFGIEPGTDLTVVEDLGDWVKTHTDTQKPINPQ
jgi:hypothetical protein